MFIKLFIYFKKKNFLQISIFFIVKLFFIFLKLKFSIIKLG
ncbi:MAG: hypothetical protein NVS84_00515 [Candidatus Carsonella ruddii]|nr:MAG: hypothetical protein NVS84_00515 [Candidatus Carsonella ruddii]WMC19546.1 MAG: hypothetical protein NVS85_00510 [Candidatus Carsonella ruddii]